jgi:LPS export ABC transporter protein LptC
MRIKIFILPLLLLASTACSELTEYENKQVGKALADSLFTTTESWDIRMEILEEGKLKLILEGSYAATIKNETQNLTKIKGPVYIEIFNSEGISDTFVHADSAVHHPKDSYFELFGHVRVAAPGGKKLRSDYLKWEREKDRVSTPKFVIFISPPDSIAAQGFFGNSDLTNYTLNEGGGRVIIN